MKKQSYLLSFIFTFLLTSCVVYEDIHLSSNGNIEYQLKLDGSESFAVMDGMSFETPENIALDTLISFSEFAKDSLVAIPPEYEEDIKNIAPLFLKIENDPENKKFAILIMGSFSNIQEFYQAFDALDRLDAYTKSKENEEEDAIETEIQNPSLGKFSSQTPLTWDGTILKRTFNDKGTKQDNNRNAPKIMNLFGQGRMIISYHFDKKVIQVNHPKAIISNNEKTVTLEYSGSIFENPTEDLSIEILIEN